MNISCKSKLFLILSSHRSGSSATAGILDVLGVHMGDSLLKPSSTNPKGYFENVDFVYLNDKILNSIGAAWDNPPKREELRCSIELSSDIFSFLSKHIKPLWGLKDPRMILTFDIWKPYLNQLGDITYIFTWRPIQESVSSLVNRNKIDEQTAVNILTRYQENLIYYRNQLEQENKDIIDVHFDKLLENPEKIVKEINCRIGKKYYHNLDNVTNFLDKKLKHF
ncbi:MULTISPECIES: sulfotransferase family protein [Bacillus cereus group]|uniref:Sulfotransferase family protein n=1 Tax=Bacillus cereus TaxID=1396 RepID=A0A9W7QA71_BACCE|nr:sulfotransferase family protein [Bacillus cereus]KAB2388947.1 sulfotransferase family protein [Bacillus cereus]KAB2406385.1 sulfotransferase family protein [Bacillus cereus]KAB2427401.1 sulfotransferase family protein [Bacillus cereus]